jgi:hypothetical protein
VSSREDEVASNTMSSLVAIEENPANRLGKVIILEFFSLAKRRYSTVG